MIKIHWITQQPTPYNDYLFRCFHSDNEIHLTVHFIRASSGTHPWKTALAKEFLSRTYHKQLGLDWTLLRQGITDHNAIFVVGGNWFEPTIVALVHLLSLQGKPFIIWSDTLDIRHRHPLKAMARKLWLRVLFANAFRVMGTGDKALSIFKVLGCLPQKLVNFPYFVDIKLFTPSVLWPEKIVFLSSGRLINSIKGHDLAIRALAIARRHTRQDFHYLIAGTGPDESILRTLVQQSGLQEYIEFVGWLEPEQLPSFYRSGQILLHPSLWDPFAVSILEAMACGLAVIASDRTMAAVDRIKPMYNGLLHRTGDVEDLAEKIEFLLSHPELIQQFGKAARTTAEEWPGKQGVQIIKDIANHAIRN